MADDPALIWQDDRPRPRRRRPRPRPDPAQDAAGGGAARAAEDSAAEVGGGRIPLRDAHHQFGVAPSTLASWARAGKVDAVKDHGRWMVTPASVAARLTETRRARSAKSPATRRDGAAGPTADGSSMLVPRDAWDKLLDQLGNLHEAGQMLAEARERAAKSETEASFLRERLSEMRSERDELKHRLGEPVVVGAGRPGFWSRVRAVFGGATDPKVAD